jgi:murein L,D-transpeptidase YafK
MKTAITTEIDHIQRAIDNMIEENIPVKGFKEWMTERNFDHNSSYTEFYEETDEGYMMLTINKLYKHWWKSVTHIKPPILTNQISKYPDKCLGCGTSINHFFYCADCNRKWES